MQPHGASADTRRSGFAVLYRGFAPWQRRLVTMRTWRRVESTLRHETRSPVAEATGTNALVQHRRSTTMIRIRTTLVAAGLSLFAGLAAAQSADTPRIDQRQANQEQRIDNGIANGSLTQREATRLERQQDAVNRAEDRAKADGTVTKKERARLTHAQNHTSRNIYRQKHDRQSRR
jgi:hypothetical protein